jgi:trk system potassium uptake protein TrkA
MNFIIIGCGRVGTGLVRPLTQRGHTVVLVDSDPAVRVGLGAGDHQHTIIGSALDHETLLQAGITHADGLAAVTGSDEVNIVVASLARRVFRVPRVVARLYDPHKAEVYRRLGLQTINPATWGIARIAELLSYARLQPTASLGSGEVDLIETEVPSLLVGRTVNDVTIPGEVQVAAISRRGRTFLPTLGTTFSPGDLVHLIVLTTAAKRAEALFADA